MSARNSIHDPAPRDTQPGATVSKAATVTNVEAEITEMSGITPQPTYMADEKIIEEGWAPGHGKKPSDDGIDHYFVGPRDLDSHSKLPHFMRLHGSVMPKMIVPLLVVGAWATLITVISKYVYNLGIQSVLLTVLGFVVGLGLSFRSTTAYERYAEGRKYWALLNLTSRNLARVIWVHVPERPGAEGKDDLLYKITSINLILAFAVALKHKLRFEPHIHYQDLNGLVSYLDTFAKDAYDPDHEKPKKMSPWKSTGNYLGIPFSESNPRKAIKRSKKPVGNLPLEIITYLSGYCETLIGNGSLKLPIMQTQFLNNLTTMTEVLTGTERVLHTPLPAAYSILISQITWIYVLMLPFQLYSALNWVTIPGTMIASYIILGLAAIGGEIENPFGRDVNDLPLDNYCQELASELDIIMSAPAPNPEIFMKKPGNLVLFPLSKSGAETWGKRDIEDIRAALKTKAVISGRNRSRANSVVF